MPNRKDRFKPRAEASMLSRLIQEAWKDYQDAIASEADQDRIGETLATQFEQRISPTDFEVLKRWDCISTHDTCNVAVYDPTRDGGAFGERFGVPLPREIPVVGNRGMGYPSLAACCPHDRDDLVPKELDSYFAGLLAARKAYFAEYKASQKFPQDHKEATSQYPTWGEIEDKFPVLGAYLAKHREVAC